MHAAGLNGIVAQMGGAGAVAWIGALPALFEGLTGEDVQRIAGGEDPADVLAPEQLAAWEPRSAELDALDGELTDPA